ncbi:MAG: ABC transporter ATP-binding protein [Clostridia bacterium]|nr:ABC transporter ATP-binding protein [Clostridia bacterium]
MLRFVAPYRFSLILSLLTGAVSVAALMYIPVLIGRAVDMIAGKGRVDFAGVAGILVRIAVAVAVSAVLQWIMTVLNNRMTYNVVRDMRRQAFGTIQELPVSYIDSRRHGTVVSRVISDADVISDGLLLGFSQLFSGVMTVAVTLVFMIRINPVLAAVVAVLTPLSLFVSRFVASRTYGYFRKQAEVREEETAFAEEIVSSQKTVKAFSMENECRERFSEVNGRLEKATVRAVFFSSLVNPSTRFVNGIVYAAVALIGSLIALGDVPAGALTVGGLSSFLSYANQYTKPFNEISGVISELQNAIACAARLFELIDSERETDSPDGDFPREVKGDVDFCDLSFSYSKDKPLLTGVDLSVRAGQQIAIVGPTGCGKTTLINLLMRFYEPDEGKITLDGEDIRNIPRHRLRSNYGMVLQDTWLKNATVRDNIALGKPDATDGEIVAAAEAVHAHNFIKRLPDGYNTILGEDGGSLSAGQKQLISVARVMLCLPPMLILDEATSSIDTRTEMEIQASFARLTKGRTSFIVAHRLSTVRGADRIIVMRDGNIVESGTHRELLEAGGFYRHLYDSQFAH